ncbi:hypothetical protein BDV11DRAFT_180658 [Aspergillus similis]
MMQAGAVAISSVMAIGYVTTWGSASQTGALCRGKHLRRQRSSISMKRSGTDSERSCYAQTHGQIFRWTFVSVELARKTCGSIIPISVR